MAGASVVKAARAILKSRRSREPGRLVRVPLGDGTAGYGRQLDRPLVAFYGYFRPEDEEPDLLDIVEQRVAFSVWVMDRAFTRNGRWSLLDVVPLSQEESIQVHLAFKHDPISGALSIHWSDAGAGTWGERAATRAECEGLERAAVWDPEHVEDRLRDHRAGRPNKWAESLKLPD